jgi:hypothetical protein
MDYGHRYYLSQGLSSRVLVNLTREPNWDESITSYGIQVAFGQPDAEVLGDSSYQ